VSDALLVLAASLYQVPAIRAARALGVRVITCDNVPDNPGHALGDERWALSTLDREAILARARDAGLRGVVATCTDVAVPTAAFLAARLGLRGPPLAAAEVCCNKVRFRAMQVQAGLRHPEHRVVDAPVAPFSPRCVLKPDAASGSKGIAIVESLADVEAHWPEALRWRRDEILMEAFIDGHQGTLEGVLEGGAIVRHWLLDRRTMRPPYVATREHRFPSRLPRAARDEVLREIERTTRAVGLERGVFDCDFVIAGEEVTVLEISPRLGGNNIAGLVLAASGVDLYEVAVRDALGLSNTLNLGADRAAAVLILGAERDGALRYDEAAVRALAAEPWVSSLRMDHPLGTPVRAFRNGRERVGDLILTAPDRDTLDRRGEEARVCIALSAEAS